MTPIAERQDARQEIIETHREISKFLCTPHDQAVSLYQRGSCIENLGARLLSLVQIIVSIVAFPLALLGTILALLSPCYICSEGESKLEIRRMEISSVAGIAGEQLARIGESLIAVFFPCTLIGSLPTKD